MKNYFSSDFRLGVLGGGQLGRMLLIETQKMDIYTVMLDKNKDAPCANIANEFHQGDLQDFETVYQFGKKVDLLTIEIENVNIEALDKLEQEGLTIYPRPKDIRIIQNKAIQKQFYIDNKIPTAAFKRFENATTLKKSIEDNKTKLPFVWKATRFGYDGTGVKIIRTLDDLKTLPKEECIAEDLVRYKNELAVIVARNPSGDIKTYPVVEMEFHPEANQVEYVLCPARIDNDISKKAREVALNTAAAFNFVGLLAVELFQTENDEIIVNEVAPRTHNSGHYSNEASYTSQFQQHLRSILDLPLGNTDNKISGIMVNLVGEDGFTGDVIYENIEEILKIDGVSIYIYGKKQTKPFRKMGHITIVHKDINEARKIAELVKKSVRVISK